MSILFLSLAIMTEIELTAWMRKNKSASQLELEKCKEKVPSSGQTKNLTFQGHILTPVRVNFQGFYWYINMKVLKKQQQYNNLKIFAAFYKYNYFLLKNNLNHKL